MHHHKNGRKIIATKKSPRVSIVFNIFKTSTFLIPKSDLPPPNVSVLGGDGYGEQDQKGEGAEAAQDAPDMASDMQLKAQLDSVI